MDNDIIERAKEYADIHKATEFNYFGVGQVYGYERIYNAEITAYERGAKEQKAIDEKYIKLLEEDRNAFIAFCYNIINGKYISVIDAAKEQLSYLENKVMEE